MSQDIAKDFEEVLRKIGEVQDPEWDGRCTQTDCYWNLACLPFNDKARENFCVSESLSEVKVFPNTKECPSYWCVKDAIGDEL